MIFRRRLLILFAAIVLLCVAMVAWTISSLVRRAFERANDERTTALVAQFRREFDRRGENIARRVEAIAAGETATQMSLVSSRDLPDYATYFNEAKTEAENQQLDFLEFFDAHRTIISSAQWPAKFGYKETFKPTVPVPTAALLMQEELPTGKALGLCAVRSVNLADNPIFVEGCSRINKDFLAGLDLPAGMRVMLYQNLTNGFSPDLLIDSAGVVQRSDLAAPLILQSLREQREASQLVHWSSDPKEDENLNSILLRGLDDQGHDNQLLGILLIGNSRRPYVELRQQIRSATFLSGFIGMLFAAGLSGWAAARVTRPVEQLVLAARDVSAGNWNTKVPVTTSDELGELAESFNRMTAELLEQREHLVQAERVAAWRELGRRLAHELKNPLFPLQLTVENLIRAQEQSPNTFDEIFQESTSMLLAEIGNLKTIISRFSDFSKMPQPQFESVNLNDAVKDVARLFQSQFDGPNRLPIKCKLELAEFPVLVEADPQLLHRALSNLILNAMDAMPEGGLLFLRTRLEESYAQIEVKDTGIGLTPEECARVFTPYYTSKAHGTGLGLAIVQSIVSDHGGRIHVRSNADHGTTFVVELPRNRDKLRNDLSEGITKQSL